METEKKKASNKFFIEDNMCTPYKLILSRANRFLIENGWENANSPDEADLHIVGGCAAFHSLENEALELIESAKDSEKAPHVYMGYLLLWTALVGAIVLIVFPRIDETIGLVIIGVLIVLFCLMVQVFHVFNIFDD